MSKITSHCQVSRYIRPCTVLGAITGRSMQSNYCSRRKSEKFHFSKVQVRSMRPTPLGGFFNGHGEHLIYFLLFKFSCLRPCSVLGWVNWSTVHLLEFDSLLHCLNKPRCSSDMLLDCVNTFINLLPYVEFSSSNVRCSPQSVFEVSSDSFTVFWQSTCSLRRSASI